MTQRTEGLVTYTEETRVTEATVATHGKASVAEIERRPDGRFYLSAANNFTPEEFRALRDAITVMLGDDTRPTKNAQAALKDAAEVIIARLEKYRASHHPIQDDFTDGLVAAYRTAEQLVREEYGL